MNETPLWRRPWLLLLASLVLAAFLRFWQLDTLPPGLYHDEAYNGLDALSLLRGDAFPRFYEGWELYAADAHAERPPVPTTLPVFFEGNFGREPLHIYLMALSIRLLGATPLAVRAVPAAAGVLSVLTTYLAAGALLGSARQPSNPRPLVAAFTLAVLYPALTFSRFGIRAMLFLPLATLCVYSFWQGLGNERSTRQRLLWWVGAGFFLGAGLYTYAAARLLPFLFLLFVPYWLWRERPGRAGWLAAGAMAATAVLVAAPLLLYFWRYPYFLVFRTAFVANKGRGAVPGRPWLTWLNNIGRVLAGLVWRGETHLRHNLPGRPFLDIGQSLFFVAGLGPVLAARRPRDLFLLLWLFLMLLPSILSGDAPHFGRLSGAAPPVAIVVALGVDALWQRLERRRLAVLGVTAVLLLSAVITFHDYFSRYASHPQLATDFYAPDWAIGRYAADVVPESDIYLVPPQAEMATIYFALEGQNDRWRSFDNAGTLLPLGRGRHPVLYIVRPDESSVIGRLERFFPDTSLTPYSQEALFFAPARGSRPLLPGSGADARWGGEIALERWSASIDGGDLHVTLIWRALRAPASDYTAFVHLRQGDAPPIAQSDRPPAGYPTGEWRQGELVADTFTIRLDSVVAPATYRLETGFYTLEDGFVLLGDSMPLAEVNLP